MGLNELDASLFFLINRGLSNNFFDLLMPFMTHRGMLLCLPFLALAALKEKKRLLPFLVLAAAAVGLADGSGNMLKHIFERVRPCHVLEGVNLLAGCSGSGSMPSNHAANSFAFALAFLPLGRRWLTAAMAALAATVAFSRVYIGVHYPGDVLAGALLGTAAAWFAHFCYRRISRAVREQDWASLLFLMLGLVTLFRVYHIITGPFELVSDEAHYWEWSRRPDWSYYSKGPLVAYVIYAGTHIFGNTEFGVRFFAVVLSGLSSYVIFLLGRRLYDAKAGFIAAALVQLVPLYSFFGIFMTIDSLFICFWILSLYLFWRAFEAETSTGRTSSPLLLWFLLGLSIGAGMLAKHLILIFYLSGFLFMLLRPEARMLLRRGGPYLSLVTGLTVFLPVIWWNSLHSWVMFRHTAGQAHISDGLRISFKDFGEYLGSQIGLVTPVLFFMLLAALWQLRKDLKGAFLFWFSVPTLLFFGLKSLQGKVQGNWALAAYATGFIAFAAWYMKSGTDLSGRLKHFVRAAFIVAGLATVLGHFPQSIQVPAARHLIKKITGWKNFGQQLSAIHAEMSAEGPVFLLFDNYQAASLLAFYMKDNPVTYCLNFDRRMNQYDLWPGYEGFIGQNALFARKIPGEVSPEGFPFLTEGFERCEKQVVEVETKLHLRMKFDVYKCYHFKGFKPAGEKRY